MFLPLVLSVFLLHFAAGAPVEVEYQEDDPETQLSMGWESRKFSPDLEIFDTDHWYKWWYGSNKRKSTIQERLQTIETRQRVLYDLIMCESNSRIRTILIEDECRLFRANAEAVFRIPPKGPADRPLTLIVRPSEDDSINAATKVVISAVTAPPPTTVVTTVTPVPTTVTAVPTTVTAAPTTVTAVPTTVTPVPTTRAPIPIAPTAPAV